MVVVEEVKKLFEACFIREIQYLIWLSNMIMIKKYNGKCVRM